MESQLPATSVESAVATPATITEPVAAEEEGNEAKEKDDGEEKEAAEGEEGDEHSSATKSSAPAAAAAAATSTNIAATEAVDPTKVGGRYNCGSGENFYVGRVFVVWLEGV